MRKRPITIVLVGVLFLYFPSELLVHYCTSVPVTLGDAIVSGLLPLIAFAGALRVTRLGWYTLVVFVALWGVHDFYLFYELRGDSPWQFLAHISIYVLSLGCFINPRIRTLYFDPSLCWWKAKPRFETHLPLLLKKGEQWQYPILRNISEGGCFVEMNRPPELKAHVDLAIPLPIPLNVSVIHTGGEVRWVSDNPLRPGVGVQFKNTPSLYKKAIRQFVQWQL